VEVLDRSTCVELLHTFVIGRVAWATESGDAVVIPVNFIVVDTAWSSGPRRDKTAGVSVEHSPGDT
jgi:hypothetical protein